MKCFKCGKEMDREDGGKVLKGIEVNIDAKEEARTEADIAYYNKQLGVYSDGEGKCDVAICFECYLDGLFKVRRGR